MNASTVTSTAQAPTNLPAPVQHLLLTELSPSTSSKTSGHLTTEQIELRANTLTVVLKEIMADHGENRDFGINE